MTGVDKKTTQGVSRGERWGMKAAHGVKWLVRQLKNLDQRCVEKARNKNWPGWLGHLPLTLISMALLVASLSFAALLVIIISFCLCVIFWGFLHRRIINFFIAE